MRNSINSATVDSIKDKVHAIGMSESTGTHFIVTEFDRYKVEPPLHVDFERGEDPIRVSLTQGLNRAQYEIAELQEIGEGDSITGLNRVIGAIATSGPLERNAIKPLHPDIFDSNAIAVVPAGLPGPHPDVEGHAVVLR